MKSVLLSLLLAVTGCGAASHEAFVPRSQRAVPAQAMTWEESTTPTMAPPPGAVSPMPTAASMSVADDPMRTLVAASTQAPPGARRVLDTVRAMLDAQTVTRGSCYTWVNAVYRRAGGPRAAVFDGDRRTRWAEASMLQPGDWVFFVNHSYGDVTHSAIFVAWIDEPARVALMVSYPGENRDAPGRFGDYALTNVYRLVRMRDEAPTRSPGAHG